LSFQQDSLVRSSLQRILFRGRRLYDFSARRPSCCCDPLFEKKPPPQSLREYPFSDLESFLSPFPSLLYFIVFLSPLTRPPFFPFGMAAFFSSPPSRPVFRRLRFVAFLVAGTYAASHEPFLSRTFFLGRPVLFNVFRKSSGFFPMWWRPAPLFRMSPFSQRNIWFFSTRAFLVWVIFSPNDLDPFGVLNSIPPLVDSVPLCWIPPVLFFPYRQSFHLTLRLCEVRSGESSKDPPWNFFSPSAPC